MIKNIDGLIISKIEHKIKMLADHTTLILSNIKSLIKSISIFNHFSRLSGLKLKMHKSEVIPLGTLRKTKLKLHSVIQDITKNNGPFKCLGIWFAFTEKEITELNFGDRVKINIEYKLIGTETKVQDDIANQFIAHNQYIKINGKPINDLLITFK